MFLPTATTSGTTTAATTITTATAIMKNNATTTIATIKCGKAEKFAHAKNSAQAQKSACWKPALTNSIC